VKGGFARTLGMALVGIALGAGGFYLVRSFQAPNGGKADNVAEAPAGGRTQAQPTDADTTTAAETPPAISPLGDPLQPGMPETPDIPPDSPHAGVKKVGDRIVEAVEKDGTIGDDEVPGIDLTRLSQGQRRWFLAHAVKITCTCGCRQDLLECRRDDATCPVSPRLVDSLTTVAL
jgi:hypothetical protein